MPSRKERLLQVEVWSDVVCPWCYIGKRRLEKAIAEFDHAVDVEVIWRSFQLDPSFPAGVQQPVHEYLAAKYGTSPAQARAMTDRTTALAAQEGLAFDTDRARMVNTFDAQRLIQLAKQHGRAAEMVECLKRAHHIEGEAVDDRLTLIRLGTDAGVPAEEVAQVLATDEYSHDVREDTRLARAFGATGVPFFVLERAFGVSGAQPVETFLSALRAAHEHTGTAGG
jgi:predicted DsbA family dithiol-disulfide isomerase